MPKSPDTNPKVLKVNKQNPLIPESVNPLIPEVLTQIETQSPVDAVPPAEQENPPRNPFTDGPVGVNENEEPIYFEKMNLKSIV